MKKVAKREPAPKRSSSFVKALIDFVYIREHGTEAGFSLAVNTIDWIRSIEERRAKATRKKPA